MDTPTDQSLGDVPFDLDISFLDDVTPAVTGAETQTFLVSQEDVTDSILAHDLPNLQDDDVVLGSLGKWDDATASFMPTDPQNAVSEPDYTRFENWIPEFDRPPKACDYCRSKHLACYRSKGEAACTPCKCLFRECSLNSTTMEAFNYAKDAKGVFFDTLHPVAEDICAEQGERTKLFFLNSKSGPVTTTSVTSQLDDAPGSSRRNGIRFPRHAVRILRDWLDLHQDHPYPTEEEKVELEKSTGLTPTQIANWLANARRRRKVVTKTRTRGLSPSPRPATPAIDIPEVEKAWDELNPMERWQHSPPENEPAAMTDIANAVANSDLPEDASSPSSLGTRPHKGSSNGSGFSGRRPPSTTSAETSQASSLSASSSAAVSRGSSQGSFGSFRSNLSGKRDRRQRKRATPLQKPADDKKRTFQCTFCTDTFRSKYDWNRHEKTLHISLEKWICAPIGPVIVDQATGQRMCVYCGLQNPPDGHEEAHNHRSCEEKGLEARTFYRKDHLRQHLRLVHGCEMVATMEAWNFTTTKINSRCGFCAQRFNLWQDRVDHLTAHFRAGTRMIDWRGCRGFDPAVAAQVTNAMPPYLIGIESVSLNPFSATNSASMRDVFMNASEREGYAITTAQNRSLQVDPSDNLPAKASCWEILTVRLGKFAKDMVAKGVVLTDEMLQSHARLILYDSDDSWNQTAADNSEWLDLFKKAHGLDFIPSNIGGQGQNVPEDIEVYTDLGMRVPFFVQLQQYNKVQSEQGGLACDRSPEALDGIESRKELRQIYQQLANKGVLHGPGWSCSHETCQGNVIDIDFLDRSRQSSTRQRLWCSQALTPDNATQFARLVLLAQAGTPVTPTSPRDAHSACTTQQADEARVACLMRIQHGEVSCCPFEEYNERGAKLAERREMLNTAQKRSGALAALARHEGSICDDTFECSSNVSVYLPRHKLELPANKAACFATITPAWKDSGKMPKPITTVQTEHSTTNATSTGAMMEFLGPSLGQHLPFSTNVATSTIPLPTADTTSSETQGLDAGFGDAFSRDATSSADDFEIGDFHPPELDASVEMPWTSGGEIGSATTTAEGIGSLDATMGGLDNEELDFDSVFNMSVHDTYDMVS